MTHNYHVSLVCKKIKFKIRYWIPISTTALSNYLLSFTTESLFLTCNAEVFYKRTIFGLWLWPSANIISSTCSLLTSMTVNSIILEVQQVQLILHHWICETELGLAFSSLNLLSKFPLTFHFKMLKFPLSMVNKECRTHCKSSALALKYHQIDIIWIQPT